MAHTRQPRFYFQPERGYQVAHLLPAFVETIEQQGEGGFPAHPGGERIRAKDRLSKQFPAVIFQIHMKDSLVRLGRRRHQRSRSLSSSLDFPSPGGPSKTTHGTLWRSARRLRPAVCLGSPYRVWPGRLIRRGPVSGPRQIVWRVRRRRFHLAEAIGGSCGNDRCKITAK